MKLGELEKSIGYTFRKTNLLKKALTHTSYANDNNTESNEKLEFLGDSILEYVSSEMLYTKYELLKEGEMTKVRAAVVCESSLYAIAKKHNFSDFLYLGKSEQKSKGKYRPAVLADAVEAIIAAIYLDGGMKPTKKFIEENLDETINIATKNVGSKDYKTVLQEKLQKNGDVKIKYEIIKEDGPDHNKTFETKLCCDGEILSYGRGKSKKEAEMNAAKEALEKIN